ncbi:alpha/beta fold hydrolase [Caballeronia ptereochthonis]|uniref:alpha/beta fold hydrolase n=1 Tax=Caballeronia ptereochthonis TaxID=1777144 RepID=UPI00117D5141
MAGDCASRRARGAGYELVSVVQLGTERRRYRCTTALASTPEGQSLEAWLDDYDRAVEPSSLAPTILVGHSLGAVFALRLVERSIEPFHGLFLASPFIGALGLPDYDTINHSFFAESFDSAGIRDRKGKAGRCWAGDNVPYVPLARSQEGSPQPGNANRDCPWRRPFQLRDGIQCFPSIVRSYSD